MSAVQRVIFFIESPFNARDFKRFGIELLAGNGFVVEVWDFTPLLHPEVQEKVNVPDPINFQGLRQFWTGEESVSAIRSLSADCLVISLVGYCLNSYKVYKSISLSKARYALFLANNLPAINCKSVIPSFIMKLRNLKINRIPSALFVRVPYFIWGIRAADIVLGGGEKSLDNIPYLVSHGTERWCIHTLDYDIYLESIERSQYEINKAVCVFLDEYLPLAPDYVHLKIPPPCSVEEYYPRMCRFFDMVEKQLNVEVIIAAHPRSHYDNCDPLFGGRRVIRGKTFELVRSTKFTIAHSSTSINFAVMLEKPIIFVTTDKIKLGDTGPYIAKMSELLGKKEINLDGELDIDFEREMKIDNMAYSMYKNDFIKKTGTDDLMFWQVVSNQLNKISH